MQRSFEEAVEELCKRHPDRYSQDAYFFLRDAFDHTLKNLKDEKDDDNLTAGQLFLGVCAYANYQFGPLSEEVLNRWGIFSSRNVGEMVYNLIDMGLFGSRRDDAKSDFEDLGDVHTILTKLFLDRLK
ncbi:MAG: Minf_1886 family protein [Akkermansia sp.]|nr:hypothetical protein [Akkermansia sp.]